jgi:hypothetical protein
MSSAPDPSASLAALSAEAAALLEKAKEYRAKLDALPSGDPRRPEYEQLIRDLLKTSNSISFAVTASVKGS